ncbi:MAG: hypothetical protein CO136_00955 [Candidatus Levybacteria bacterium CG_4_9_14_3_um_filter_36_7]|nr:MAG: hypothetical protein CO136_00955 [Candidatus Levybacteria bacterium CG_4_9_14_3_um_filter_36_7]
MNDQLHEYQKEIIKKLSFTPTLRFNDLLIEEISSEHMNYHLKQLIELNLVTKTDSGYSLTDKGKDFSNLLDDEMDMLEKQPKCSVIVNGVRKNPHSEIEYLLNRRLKQPYFGKVGRISGKVRFGEKLVNAAKRELFEETGLTAKFWQLEKMYRKMRTRNDQTPVQDVFFYIFFARDFEGTLIEKTRYQENIWVTKHNLFHSDEFDPYDDLDLDERDAPQDFKLVEAFGDAVGY